MTESKLSKIESVHAALDQTRVDLRGWQYSYIVVLSDVRANGTGKTIFAPTGKDVLFGCPLNSSEPIVCETTPFGQSKPRSLYDGKMFLDEFRDSSRFGFLYSGIPGCPSLRINNVESNDAGRFNCYGSSNLYQCLYNLVVTGMYHAQIRMHHFKAIRYCEYINYIYMYQLLGVRRSSGNVRDH